MSDSIQCPNCAKRYPANPKYLGMEVRCKNCGQVFTVGGGTQETGLAETAASPGPAPVPAQPEPSIPVARLVEAPAPVARPVEAAVPEARAVQAPVEPVVYGEPVCGEPWSGSPAPSETYPMTPMRGGELPSRTPLPPAAPTLADVDKGSVESWLSFLAYYKLATILFAWTFLITIGTWFRGSLTFFLLGCVVLAAGILIATLGLRPQSYVSRLTGSHVSWAPSVVEAVLGGIIATMIMVALGLRVLQGVGGPVTILANNVVPYLPIMILCLMVLIVGAVLYRASRQFGFFRPSAAVFVPVSLIIAVAPVITLDSLRLQPSEAAVITEDPNEVDEQSDADRENGWRYERPSSHRPSRGGPTGRRAEVSTWRELFSHGVTPPRDETVRSGVLAMAREYGVENVVQIELSFVRGDTDASSTFGQVEAITRRAGAARACSGQTIQGCPCLWAAPVADPTIVVDYLLDRRLAGKCFRHNNRITLLDGSQWGDRGGRMAGPGTPPRSRGPHLGPLPGFGPGRGPDGFPEGPDWGPGSGKSPDDIIKEARERARRAMKKHEERMRRIRKEREKRMRRMRSGMGGPPTGIPGPPMPPRPVQPGPPFGM